MCGYKLIIRIHHSQPGRSEDRKITRNRSFDRNEFSRDLFVTLIKNVRNIEGYDFHE